MKYLPRILFIVSTLAFIAFLGFYGTDILRMLTDEGIMPRSVCWSVKSELLPWNYGAHATIMLAYFGIGARWFLISYRRGRQTLTYETVLYGGFIFLCGITHLTALLMFFWGIATIDTVILNVTALISVLAMIRTFKMAPRLEQAPSLDDVTRAKLDHRRAVDGIKDSNRSQADKIQALDESAQNIFDLVDRYAKAGMDEAD